MSYKSLKYLLLAVPLLAGACDDTYVAVRSTDYFPYGDERTAGSAVVYVQSKMLAERKLNLDPISNHAKVKDEVLKSLPPLNKPIKTPPKTEVKILRELEQDLEALFQSKLRK